MIKINLEFPDWTQPQIRIAQSQSRFNAAVWGRQTGKTTFGLDKMIYRPITGRPGGIYWYVLQTNNAAEIAFNRYWETMRGLNLLLKKPNETQRLATLINGSAVHFKSGDNFEDLRAETLDGAIIDECRQQDRRLWTSVMRAMLGRRKGWCDFYSTPNGFDWFYDQIETAKSNPKEWSVFHAPCSESPWWTPEELDSARATASEAEFAQEYMAEFRDMTSGRAYTNYSEKNDRADSPFKPGHEYSELLPVYVCPDFNLAPMAWAIGQCKGLDFHFTDEIWLPYISDPFEPAKNLVAKLRAIPHDVNKLGVRILGDATGKATQRTSLQSDYDILCQTLDLAQIRWINETPESNPGVKDRVNTVNARLRDANGQIHLTLNPAKCPKIKRDFLRTTWKKSAQVPTLDSGTNKELGHASDGPGYLVTAKAPLHKPAGVGSLRVIVR